MFCFRCSERSVNHSGHLTLFPNSDLQPATCNLQITPSELSVKARLNPSSGNDALTMFSLCAKQGKRIYIQFVLQANAHHPAIKFMAEISDKEIPTQTLSLTSVHFSTQTFQYTDFTTGGPHNLFVRPIVILQ